MHVYRRVVTYLSFLPRPRCHRNQKVSIMRVDKGLEAGVLLVQGILAGLTLASLYAVLLAGSLESFIAAYEVQIPTTLKL